MPVDLLEVPADPVREAAPVRGPAQWFDAAKESAAPALDGELWVEQHDARSLPASVAADWDDLSRSACVPNAFYDRWNATAAIEHLDPASDIQLILVYRRGKDSKVEARLCGLFPLVRARSNRTRLPVWRLWGHAYCFLQTPLVRTEQERPVLHALFDWLADKGHGPRLLDWSLIDGEGPFAQALTDVLTERRYVHQVVERYNRALLRRAENWEQAAAARLSRHHQRELRRLHRRLSEQGQLTLRTLERPRDLDNWQNAFLELEGAGWKGTQQTALAADSRSRDYFRDLLRAGHEAGCVQMLGLFLNHEPIALKVNLLAGEGGFAFKIAYDERLAKFSPGVQLELENVRVLHEQTPLQWMDSCAVASHFMINRLWSERRGIQRLLISTGGPLSNLAIGALPLCQAIKRSCLPSRTSSAAANE